MNYPPEAERIRLAIGLCRHQHTRALRDCRRVAFHQAREDEPRRRDAHLDDASKAQLQRPIVALKVVAEHGIGRMQE